MIDSRKYGRQVEASHARQYLDFIVSLLLVIHNTCLFDFPFSKLFVSNAFYNYKKWFLKTECSRAKYKVVSRSFLECYAVLSNGSF